MFKTALFGGFDKEEVLEHIKLSEQRHQEEVSQMKQRISLMEEELQTAKDQESFYEEQICDLRAELEAATEKLGQIRKDLADLHSRYFTAGETTIEG